MGMITTEQEYIGSKKTYEQGLNTIKTQTKYGKEQGLSDEKIKIVNAPMESFLFGIKEEIEEYEQIKVGKIPKSFMELEHVGKLLIALRISSGMNQSQLARKLNVPPSQVSRDERNEYYGVSVLTIKKHFDIYGKSLNFKVKSL
jgi:DNA-binding XRE family transcriptional regulator